MPSREERAPHVRHSRTRLPRPGPSLPGRDGHGHARRDVVPGTGRCRDLPRRSGRPRPPAPEHHRPRRRPPADVRCPRRHWIVFNGEIYNYRELREELDRRRRTFRTHSDTEVILQLYAERGERCVEALNGMFAFAIWDSARRTLFLARDRMGVKPLYYADTPEAFVFASEIKSLFESGQVTARCREEALGRVPAVPPGGRTGDAVCRRPQPAARLHDDRARWSRVDLPATGRRARRPSR